MDSRRATEINFRLYGIGGSDQGFPLDGTKFHLDGPGPSRALDPLFDAA